MYSNKKNTKYVSKSQVIHNFQELTFHVLYPIKPLKNQLTVKLNNMKFYILVSSWRGFSQLCSAFIETTYTFPCFYSDSIHLFKLWLYKPENAFYCSVKTWFHIAMHCQFCSNCLLPKSFSVKTSICWFNDVVSGGKDICVIRKSTSCAFIH